MKRGLRRARWPLLLLSAIVAGPLLVWAGGEVSLDADWRTADPNKAIEHDRSHGDG